MGNTDVDNSNLKLLFDVNQNDDDKFLHLILFNGQSIDENQLANNRIYNLCKSQSAFDFGFIPLSEPFMPQETACQVNDKYSIADLHDKIKHTNLPNGMGAHIPIENQLNVK